MKNALIIALEALFHVLGLMLKHIFGKCLKKCLMLQALKSVLVWSPDPSNNRKVCKYIDCKRGRKKIINSEGRVW